VDLVVLRAVGVANQRGMIQEGEAQHIVSGNDDSGFDISPNTDFGGDDFRSPRQHFASPVDRFDYYRWFHRHGGY
jgi:hypothetical protein